MTSIENSEVSKESLWYVDNYIVLLDYYDRTITRIAARCVRMGNIAIEEYKFYPYILDVLEEICETGNYVIEHEELHPYVERKIAGGIEALKKNLSLYQQELTNNQSPEMLKADPNEGKKINEVMSNFKDNMDEDPRTSILILKNYDGTNIPEFRQNLATYGVIKVTTVDGVQGDVDALKVEVNSSNYQALLMQLKRAIIENGYGFDAKEERMDGDPNQMNIESMYTDIDLDVDAMESEFQAGFEELKWFIDQYLIHAGNPDYTEEDVEFIFDRDFFINENAQIDNVMKSVGLVSNKTLLSHHPMVTNVLREMQLIEEKRKAYFRLFQSIED